MKTPPPIAALLSQGVVSQVLATGALPSKVEAIGAVTNTVQTLGTNLLGAPVVAVFTELAKLVKGSGEAPGGGTLDGVGLVQLVLAAIKGIVNNLEKGGEETKMGFSAARMTMLATPRVNPASPDGAVRITTSAIPHGMSVFRMSDLPPVGYPTPDEGQARGTYLFKRPGSDRWLPYLDPVALWLLPPFLRMGLQGDSQGGGDEPNFLKFGDECYKSVNVMGDAGKQDCQAHADGRQNAYSFCWSYAWPMTSPNRIMGAWSRFGDLAAERVAAGLYLLPTVQHVQTRIAEVLTVEKMLRTAMAFYFPNAEEVSPGQWLLRTPAAPADWQPNPKAPWSYFRPDFVSLAEALRRIVTFKRVRAMLVASKGYWPYDLAMQAGEDFA